MPKPRQSRHSRQVEDWELHRDTIYRIYLKDNNTLSYTMQIMKHMYGFQASERKYKKQLREWKFCKNLPASDMRAIVAKATTRARHDGKDTEFFIDGQLLTAERIENFKKRVAFNEDGVELPSAATPPNITYNTPLPENDPIDIEYRAALPDSNSDNIAHYIPRPENHSDMMEEIEAEICSLDHLRSSLSTTLGPAIQISSIDDLMTASFDEQLEICENTSIRLSLDSLFSEEFNARPQEPNWKNLGASMVDHFQLNHSQNEIEMVEWSGSRRDDDDEESNLDTDMSSCKYGETYSVSEITGISDSWIMRP